MPSKLPPIDVKQEERFEAFQETKEINLVKCDHMSPKSKVVNSEIHCQCGAGWSGPNIARLAKLLKII